MQEKRNGGGGIVRTVKAWAIGNEEMPVSLDGHLCIYREKVMAETERDRLFPAHFQVFEIELRRALPDPRKK
jgi:hypothetical protein